MKIQLEKGVKIEVGDMIRNDHGLGINWWNVVRVTPKFALVKYNDIAEVKFRRVVDSNGFVTEAGNTDIWSQNRYTAWRLITVDKKEGGKNA